MVKTPPGFSFKACDWKDWRDEFLKYRNITKLADEPGDRQRDSLIYHMGTKKAEEVKSTFTWKTIKVPDPAHPNDRNKDTEELETDTMFDVLIGKYTQYFVPKVNVINESLIFNKRIQKAGESVEEFARDLQTLVRTCSYKEPQRMVRDRFVAGLTDIKLQEKLQFKLDLTLETALDMARRHEMIKKQVKEQQGQSLEADEVRSRGHGGHGGHRGRGRGRGRGASSRQPDRHLQAQAQASQDTRNCVNCGYKCGGDKCPARGKKCLFCSKIGHFKGVCQKKRAQEAAREVVEEHVESASWYIGMVSCDEDNGAWTVPLVVGGSTVVFKIDTGADVSIIPETVYQSMSSRPRLQQTATKLTSPGGRLACLGEFQAQTHVNGRDYHFRVVVVAESTSCLLGRSAASRMGLVARVEEVNRNVFGASGLMNTEPIRITLEEGAAPHCVTTCRRIPFPIMGKVKEELDKMERADIISKVTQPTDWCSPIVPVIKKNGRIRICIDLKRLNKAVKRPHYMLPNLDDIAPALKDSKLFTTLDASSGFLQIPLEQSSALYTTFITPFGRYCCNRLPFGITSGPEEFQRKASELLEGLEGAHVIMDDILIHGKTLAEHDARLDAVLKRVEASGLKLNREKCQIRKPELTYFGHTVGSSGIKPQPDKIRAIEELPTPKCVTELRSALGMINYLAKFTPSLSSMTKPLTELLKSGVAWYWGQPQRDAFAKVKAAICKAQELAYYDVTKPTVVSADASSYGLGAVILQQSEAGLQPVAFCSRTLTAAERRYAQIEKECLASVWACEKFSRYLIGLDSFELLTDHKPLVPLMSTKNLDQAPIRCQRLLMRMMKFNPNVRHVPGKDLVVADGLSRCPLPHSSQDEKSTEEIVEHVDAIQALWPVSHDRLEAIRQATRQDQDLQIILKYILHGWPSKSSVPVHLQEYLPHRGELSLVNGIITYQDRILIPSAMQADMLARLHESHQGISKCLENARSCIWWPGMSKQVKEMIDRCMECREHRPAQRKQPLIPTDLPSRPWEKVSADLCEHEGKSYIVLIDQYSRWIDVKLLTSTSTAAVISRVKDVIATHGVMDTLKSDNGPQFVSREFQKFAAQYGFNQDTSSPHFHQANGEAESAVKVAKKIISQADPHLALLNYRSTKHSATGVSPAEALMGRRLQTRLPLLPKRLQPQRPTDTDIRAADARAKQSYKEQYDRRHGVRDMPSIKSGQPVLMRLDTDHGWDRSGTIIKAEPDSRTYLVATPTGNLRRNRRHLQPVPNLPPPPPEAESDEEDTAPAPIPPAQPAAPDARTAPTVAPGPRRSTRASNKPPRLIESI